MWAVGNVVIALQENLVWYLAMGSRQVGSHRLQNKPSGDLSKSLPFF
jgi:hypothetical protein